MTPTHTESPLRKSNKTINSSVNLRTPINDDEAERREARRSVLQRTQESPTSIDEAEKLNDCLKVYADNKLSKKNAWSFSLIDTLSNLLDKHHKSLNNLKFAGSSLEVSSKIYGLRVDSVHSDVVRMTAGLNHQRGQDDLDDSHGPGDDNISNEGVEGQSGEGQPKPDKPAEKPKRRRHLKSTVTKNLDTINGAFDKYSYTDTIFATLNQGLCNINSSVSLLQNRLRTVDSHMQTRMDSKFWDSSENLNLEYVEEPDLPDLSGLKMVESVTGLKEINLTNCVFRPDQTGYRIVDTPADSDDEESPPTDFDNLLNNDENNKNSSSAMALAFDMNAEVEPEPIDNNDFIDVDHFDELTLEDQAAINHCKGLHRSKIVIEDMRPVDATTNLEYSYRPLDKISQFWAGPSHWKFRRSRKTSLGLLQQHRLTHSAVRDPSVVTQRNNQKQRGRKAARLQNKPLEVFDVHDDLFQKLDSIRNKSLKKANIQKKWDAKKLKLPTDYRLDEDFFNIYEYAPGLGITRIKIEETITPEIPLETESYQKLDADDNNLPAEDFQLNDDHFGNDDGVDENCPPTQETNIETVTNATVLEISHHLENAPDKVTKIVVPFAKRAKIVDMKQLKYCSLNIIKKDIKDENDNIIPKLSNYPNEKYSNGSSKFSNIYKTLPKTLTPTMAESLSPSLAFYSILHLANDHNLRLIPQDDLKDFKIKQIITD